MPAAGCRNGDEEGETPQCDDDDGDPADDVEYAAAEYAPVEEADGDFQESEG